jgi:hypothetical protein
MSVYSMNRVNASNKVCLSDAFQFMTSYIFKIVQSNYIVLSFLTASSAFKIDVSLHEIYIFQNLFVHCLHSEENSYP